METQENIGVVISVNGPVVKVRGLPDAKMGSQVEVGEQRLLGEIIQLAGDVAILQVYEDTTALAPGMKAFDLGKPLSVELGPGLLGTTFDGIQRPLARIAEIAGDFIAKGVRVDHLDHEKRWRFVPTAKVGDEVSQLAIIGTVQESSSIEHRIMIPPGVHGTIASIVPEGDYTVVDTVAVVKTKNGKEINVAMAHEWPVRIPRRGIQRLMANEPLLTGQRVIDFLFPIAKGGVSAIPGGFGTGKTVTQHQLAKWCDADIIVYIGCGERGNEMTQVLEEFPELEDPRTGRPLIERTVLIANTSNMPVTAREASIYTGITIAEYYRDQGYNVALMADSTSRWAEALREISGRLEEMPAEEGYPAYLASRLAEFYERAGMVEVYPGRFGSVSAIGAVSPQGGDFSEPVTMHTQRFTRAFWGLDKELASERHFPAINWNTSYSEYLKQVAKWWDNQEENLKWSELRQQAMSLLQEENQLQKIIKLVGPDALPDAQRLIVEVARLIKVGFLQQGAFDPVDSYCTSTKQLRMMHLILHFYERARNVLRKGVPVPTLMDLEVVEDLTRMKTRVSNDDLKPLDELLTKIDAAIDQLEKEYG